MNGDNKLLANYIVDPTETVRLVGIASYAYVYTGTGAQNTIILPYNRLTEVGTSVFRVYGGTGDVYTLETALLGENFRPELTSDANGNLGITFVLAGWRAIRLNITTNTSTEITIEMRLR